MEIKTKICSSCKIEKPVSEFSKDASKADGLYTRCKACKKEATEQASRARMSQSREDTKSVREDPDRHTASASANRAAIMELIRNHQAEFASLVELHRKRLKVQQLKPEWAEQVAEAQANGRRGAAIKHGEKVSVST